MKIYNQRPRIVQLWSVWAWRSLEAEPEDYLEIASRVDLETAHRTAVQWMDAQGFKYVLRLNGEQYAPPENLHNGNAICCLWKENVGVEE